MPVEPLNFRNVFIDKYGKATAYFQKWLSRLPEGSPNLHHTTHERGGDDEIDVTDLEGLLADGQTPLAHATSHENGGSDEINVAGLTGLLATSQTPIAHAPSHQAGGSDPIALDTLAAPSDNTDLNASTAKHGLLRKLDNDATHFLDGQGAWSIPGGSGGGSGLSCNGRLGFASGYPSYSPIPRTPSSTDTGAETVTFAAAHSWLSGTIVTVTVTGGGLTAGTLYYIHVVSSTSVSFHTNVADALSGASAVNLTASITSDLQVFGIANTSLYFTPYMGNLISLYDGASAWADFEFTEVTLALGTLSSGKNYDVFAYDASGLTLELVVWTSDIVRATELALQDGVYVKSGSTTKRYVGTIRMTSTTTAEDSMLRRFCWNYYNRIARPMRNVVDPTGSSNYSTQAFRQAGGIAANRLEVVIGVNEDEVSAQANHNGQVSSASVSGAVGIGIDSTTINEYTCITGYAVNVANTLSAFVATWRAHLCAGYHAINWLETGNGTATMTWVYLQANTFARSGIRGTVYA